LVINRITLKKKTCKKKNINIERGVKFRKPLVFVKIEVQHFIPRFNKISFFMDTLKRGVRMKGGSKIG
jgi:hypothetical protein